MDVKIFTFNQFGVNSYLLIGSSSNCVLIDPGCFFEEEKKVFKEFVENNGLVIKRVLNTHLHLDHLFGNRFVEDTFGVGAECSEEELFLLDRLDMQAEMFGISGIEKPYPLKSFLKEGDVIKVDDIELYTLMVPGHSPGGLVFYEKNMACCFAGDVLFYGSIGRTDLWGSQTQLISGIKEKILSLPDDTVVFSGHGPKTTVGNEKIINPYIK